MQSSIFGNTYRGVPSPNVFHVHPYPTRYHGMNLTVPRFPMTYVENPYAVPSFMGMGAGPDGLGNVATSVGAFTGVAGALYGAAIGAVAGAVIGHFAAHKAGKGALYGAAAGGIALGLFYGTAGAAAGSVVDAAASRDSVAGLGSSCGCGKRA